MKITKLSTDLLRIPTAKPGRIPLTAPKAAAAEAIDVVLVYLETSAGIAGLGFTYLAGPGANAVRSLIETELSPIVSGEDPRETDRLLAKAEARFRGVGFAGLAARAYAAIDIALWDVKGKAAGVPIHQMLGAARPSADFITSDLGTARRDAAAIVQLAKPLLKQGAAGIRIEIGDDDVQTDADRVREISDGLGDDAWVAVAADGRFDLGTALALARFFQDIGIDCFEDPIPASDEIGYAKLAAQLETPLAVGSGFASREAFFRVIRAGSVRTIRPDACRLGGITPLLKVAAAADAYHVAVSPVRLPEVGIHLACGLGMVSNVDAVSWLTGAFTGGPHVDHGKMIPPAEPGLGLSVNEEAVAKWRSKS